MLIQRENNGVPLSEYDGLSWRLFRIYVSLQEDTHSLVEFIKCLAMCVYIYIDNIDITYYI